MKTQLQGVSISHRDKRGVLSFDLSDVLDVMGEASLTADWQVNVIECYGEVSSVAELEQLTASGKRIDGYRLARMADKINQVVDGEFNAQLASGNTVVIRVVDSSAYDFITDQSELLIAIRTRFENVAAIPV